MKTMTKNHSSKRRVHSGEIRLHWVKYENKEKLLSYSLAGNQCAHQSVAFNLAGVFIISHHWTLNCDLSLFSDDMKMT